MTYNLKYHHYSDRSILVCWPQKIDTIILRDILRFKFLIENHFVKEIVQVNVAYNSILIIYNYTIEDINSKIVELKELNSMTIELPKIQSKLWYIPVCYDERFGLDLDHMSEALGLPITHLIHLHSRINYTVFFIGFLPGFMYLGGLPKELHYPRKTRPRSKVIKGAVAIGGEQTGVYPMTSPGGWNLIGNSPINFFDINLGTPCVFSAGDQIRFQPVTLEEHELISKAVINNTYKLKFKRLDD